ncbi:hypothetical protein DPMN_117861 [Dreissena polymorpha]|uniref:Uncharacterized protein n=1 Tax=Dreissena polymorpha TaxID=45954 RepID=A0A9D4GFF7_DREPO|nr:hypothetical protein DPMN_117861 [Dreissena polymorpha]
MYIKCLDHTNKAFSILQAKIAEKDNTLSFQPDTTIDKTLSTSSGLGKILSNVKLKQHTGRSITSDATPTQAEPNAKKPSSTSSKQPDKAHTTSNTNNTDQVLHPLSSSSKISEILKVNLTNDVNDSDQVLHPVYILSEKPSAENQCHVKKSAAVSSSYSLPDISNKEGAMNKTSRESIPNKVINIISKAKYSVKVRSDKQTCNISGVCETYAGELLIMDQGNDKLKLLDKTYKVVAHYDLPYTPSSMCRIESLLVAVTLGNKEVHFIRVSKLPSMRLVHESTLKLHHACEGIAHHQGSLYITSGTALYHYTVDGTPLMEIYRNISYGDSGND